LTVVALASLVFGGYLQYRDPTLVRRALNPTRIAMPWDPSLSPAEPPIPFEPTHEPPTLLQVLQSGLATPEPPRREITYTPVYLPPPREPFTPRSDPPPPVPRSHGENGENGSAEEAYGF
jgi:hypothetical protein